MKWIIQYVTETHDFEFHDGCVATSGEVYSS